MFSQAIFLLIYYRKFFLQSQLIILLSDKYSRVNKPGDVVKVTGVVKVAEETPSKSKVCICVCTCVCVSNVCFFINTRTKKNSSYFNLWKCNLFRPLSVYHNFPKGQEITLPFFYLD